MTPENAPDEVPRRLKPQSDTLRELYLLSGNECAYPACRAPIISEIGSFVAQVCHIEAAEPGGERFNSRMTNEQRRQAANLLLLCYPHHIETNNVKLYSVRRLQDIKAAHEARYASGFDRLSASVDDWTQSSQIVVPRTLRAFNHFFGWTADSDEVDAAVAEMLQFAEKIRLASRPARQTLELIVRRGRTFDGDNRDYAVLLSELNDVTGMSESEVRSRVGQLVERRLVYLELDDYSFDDFTGPYVATAGTGDTWSWKDVRAYCEASKVQLSEIIVELRLDLFDEVPPQ